MSSEAANEKHLAEETTLRANTPEQLARLDGLLHEEYFEVADISFSPEQRVLEIPYRRIFHAGPRRTVISLGPIYHAVEVDVIRAALRIHNVVEYKVSGDKGIGVYSFNTVSCDEGCVRIAACEPLNIEARVSELLVESEYVGTKGKARISYFLGMESTSSKVRDG